MPACEKGSHWQTLEDPCDQLHRSNFIDVFSFGAAINQMPHVTCHVISFSAATSTRETGGQ
eukprot:401838-Karenia_brevis.AAC.1